MYTKKNAIDIAKV